MYNSSLGVTTLQGDINGDRVADFAVDISGNVTVSLSDILGANAVPVVIETFGSTSLVQVGNNFYLYPVGGSSGPLFKYGGSAVAVGQYPWSYIGAEQTASGYQVALRIAGTDQYTVWNTDSNGSVVSNGTGGVIVSGASSVLKSLEPSFHQDLNGDGVIGGAAAATVIESFGSTSLVQVGSNFYFYPVGGSTGPLFKYGGSAVAVGQYPWSYIGAEQTASGYQVALRIAGTDQYTVWNTDSNGSVVSNGTGGVIVTGASSVLKSLEPSFHQDLNGDGVIGGAAAATIIESQGSTSLVQVGSNFYFYPVGGSSGPLFQYGGSAVAVGQYPWSYIGAEQTTSGYQVALRIAGTDQYTVWNTDSNGNVVSNGTGGVIVTGASSVLKSLEPSFHQDLNGDGVIGGAAAPTAAVIESFGSTSLVQVGTIFYFYPVGGGSGPLFQYGGSAVAVGQYPWSYIGAEQTASGYQVALRIAGTDQYTVWNTDSNGSVVSNGTGGVIVSGASSVLKSFEPSFHQDLNGDGVLAASVISGFAGGDNFTFKADLLAMDADIATGTPEIGAEIPWLASNGQAEAFSPGEAAVWLAPAVAMPDGLADDHLASLKFGHFILH